MKIDVKALKSEVSKGLKAGQTKAELYHTLAKQTTTAREAQKIADIIRYTSHPEKLKKIG